MEDQISTKLERAKMAIEDLFSDTSVSIEETISMLEDLQDNIEERLEALRSEVS